MFLQKGISFEERIHLKLNLFCLFEVKRDGKIQSRIVKEFLQIMIEPIEPIQLEII